MSHDADNHDSADNSVPTAKESSGDVSTTGHSTHDVHEQDSHDDHDMHKGHVDDTSDAPTLVPATWSQLILPAIIFLFVAALVAVPVINAFSTRPAAQEPTIQTQAAEPTQTATVSSAGGAEESTPSTANTPTAIATAQPQTTPTTASQVTDLMVTRTAVAQAGQAGEVARIPVKLEFGSGVFTIKEGSGLLPDWKPDQENNVATWIQGTVANHILYIPFSTENEAIFKSARPGDTVKLTMNTGQVYSFAVKLSERAANGPSSKEGQLTVSTAMAQDHAGVTLFLTGDPAADRAVVQADFTGDIQ